MKSPPQRRQLTGPRLAFVKTLNAELAKFNEFFMNSEEEFVMRERRLSGEYRRVLNKEGEKADEYTVDAHKKMCRAYADFHGELVLMEHWVSLNYTALVKILKKHDKRSSSLSLRSPFLVSVLQQPFYSTEVLTQLVSKVEKRFRTLNAMLVEEVGSVPVAAGAGAGAGAGVGAREPAAAADGTERQRRGGGRAGRGDGEDEGCDGGVERAEELRGGGSTVRRRGRGKTEERTPRRGGREARGVGGGRDVHAGEEGQGVSERRVASIDSRGGTGITDDDIRGTARARDEGRPSL